MIKKTFKRLSAILILIAALVIACCLSSSYSFADDSEFVITRSEYEESESEYLSDKSSASSRQEVNFKSISINGVTNLKKPTLEQDLENHITKYEFVIEDGMTISDAIQITFDTEAYNTTISSGNRKVSKNPVIVIDKSTLSTTSNNSPDNIRSYTLESAKELIEGLGSITCSVYYKFGTVDSTARELHIVFRSSSSSSDTDYLKALAISEESGILVDDPSKTKNISVVAAEGKENVSLQIETQSENIIPSVCSAFIDENGSITEGTDISVVKDEGAYFVNLPASVDGNKYCLKLSFGEKIVDQYVLTVYARKLTGLPDNVEEFMCAPSQYTNIRGATGSYGTTRRAILSLRGANTYSTSSDDSDLSPFSLGNFGGYVTYYYKDAVTDNPNNRYGIDFIIAGNSIINDALYAEPGNVYVSEDGENWYLLAGSLHYDYDAIWDASVKYEKNEDGTSKVTLQDQSVIDSYEQYPLVQNYTLFPWNDENKQEMTFSGVMLKPDKDADSYSNTLPPYPAFGYADCGQPTESNKAENPYTGVGIGATNKVESSGRSDGFDLAWAVDSNGKPHKLENGVHYIKIQTNTFIDNAASGINEKSTEINFVRKAEPASVAMGNTYDIEKDSSGRTGISISVDGKQLELKEGQYEYDAAVNGIFDVQVDTRLDSNVYINSWHGNKATFDKAAHGIVRVIIQYGNCEPAIYYINVTQQQDDNEATAVTFDAVKGEGLISGYTKRTQYYDKDSSVTDFPIPKHRTDKVFGGWLDKDGNRYTGYSEDMPAELTLTAEWREPLDNAKLIEEITKQIAEIQEQLNQAIEDAGISSESISDWRQAIEALRNQLNEVTGHSTELDEALEQAQKQLDKAIADKKQSDDDNAALKEALLKAQKDLAKAKTEAEVLKIETQKVKGVKVKAQKKKAKVSWKSLGKGYSYEVFKSTKKNKGFKKVKTVKSTKVTLKKLKSGKKLYFKVRAYKMLDGKKVYTGYSKVIKAKIK